MVLVEILLGTLLRDLCECSRTIFSLFTFHKFQDSYIFVYYLLSILPSLYPQALLQMELQLAYEDYDIIHEGIALEENDVTERLHKNDHVA